MLLKLAFVDLNRSLRFSEMIIESPTDNVSELYKILRSQYGGNVHKMYSDNDGKVCVGWTFSKKVPYDDAPDTLYTREVWVQLLNE